MAVTRSKPSDLCGVSRIDHLRRRRANRSTRNGSAFVDISTGYDHAFSRKSGRLLTGELRGGVVAVKPILSTGQKRCAALAELLAVQREPSKLSPALARAELRSLAA